VAEILRLRAENEKLEQALDAMRKGCSDEIDLAVSSIDRANAAMASLQASLDHLPPIVAKVEDGSNDLVAQILKTNPPKKRGSWPPSRPQRPDSYVVSEHPHDYRYVRVECVPDVTCISETDAAILVRIGDEQHWFPKSLIHDDSEVYQKGDEGVLVVNRDIAEKKRLC
jgi:hypothetical protein